jgi:hypothetical protein
MGIKCNGDVGIGGRTALQSSRRSTSSMLSTPQAFSGIVLGLADGRAADAPDPAPPLDMVALIDEAQFQHLADRQAQRCRRDGQAFSALVLHAPVDPELGPVRQKQLLTECARRLCSRVRATDCVARWQESHFGILLPRSDATHAQAVLARLLRTASGHYRLGDHLLTLRMLGQALGRQAIE